MPHAMTRIRVWCGAVPPCISDRRGRPRLELLSLHDLCCAVRVTEHSTASLPYRDRSVRAAVPVFRRPLRRQPAMLAAAAQHAETLPPERFLRVLPNRVPVAVLRSDLFAPAGAQITLD